MEVWKDVLGFEGFYKVSNLGNVKGCKRVVKNKNGYRTIHEKHSKKFLVNGYYAVNLCNGSKTKQFRVHKLVAIAFLNHTPCKFKIVVDHKDNNPLNNVADNLQLITNRENSVKDKDKSNTSSKYIGVYFHKLHKKWVSRILIDGYRQLS